MLSVYFRELVQSVEENASLKKHITELTNKNQQQVCVSVHSFSLVICNLQCSDAVLHDFLLVFFALMYLLCVFVCAER